MAGAITSLFLAGVIGCVYVPRLPYGRPQRGFDLLSWFAAFKGENFNMDPDSWKHGRLEDQRPVWRAGMSVSEVAKEFGKFKVKYPMAKLS